MGYEREDHEEALRRRDHGMAQARQPLTAQEWLAAAKKLVAAQPVGFTFWPEDLLAQIGPCGEGANNNNVVGSLYRSKLVRKTGRTRSCRRPESHGRTVFEYERVAT